MGYTHYWTRVERLPATEFRIFSTACRAMAHAMEGRTSNTAGGYSSDTPVHIRGPSGGFTEKPTTGKFTRETVAFNGVGNLAHESFIVSRIYKVPDFKKDELPREEHGYESPVHWDFCKTARKPYDVVVVGSLHAADILFGPSRFRWSSDGNEEEHRDGQELAEKILNEMGHSEYVKAYHMLRQVTVGARV